VKDPPDVNVKPPPGESDKDPLPPPSTKVALKASPSASESFPRTPDDGTVRVTAVVAEYESLAAAGVALVTVIETVTVFDGPSSAPRTLYLKESAPT
jgi:hypothetical protein